VADMLVKLYALPEVTSLLAELEKAGVEIRQAHPSEKRIIAEWVRHHDQLFPLIAPMIFPQKHCWVLRAMMSRAKECSAQMGGANRFL